MPHQFKDPAKESFRRYVAELIERRGQSVRGVEQYADIPHGTLSKFLAADRWISAEALKHLADYFHIPFDELWRRSRGETSLIAKSSPEAKMAEAIGWAVIRALQSMPKDQRRLALAMAEEGRIAMESELQESASTKIPSTETSAREQRLRAAALEGLGEISPEYLEIAERMINSIIESESQQEPPEDPRSERRAKRGGMMP